MSVLETRLMVKQASDKSNYREQSGNQPPKIVSSHSFNNLQSLSSKPQKSKAPFSQDLSLLSNQQSITPNSNLNNKKVTISRNNSDPQDELQNTLKKIPKISKKLPPAFSNGFQKQVQNINKKIQSNPFQPKNDIITNLDQMIEAQEYKQTSALLSPLKHKVNPKKAKDSNDFLRVRHESVSRNPLGPLKSYIMLSKLNSSDDHLEVAGHNTSLDNIDLSSKRKPITIFGNSGLEQSSIRLDQMVTLSVMKSTHESGVIKKMLHAPTLKLYAVKEVPLSNREMRNNLKSWLNQWETLFEDSQRHLKVYAVHFNQPEGCVSIIMELINGGSVQNLLESSGTLPESIISHIAGQSLHSLNELHERMKSCHGFINPSQFLIDRAGNIKLSLGISHKTQSNAGNNLINGFQSTFGKNPLDKISLYEMNPINNPNLYQRQFVSQKEAQQSSLPQQQQQQQQQQLQQQQQQTQQQDQTKNNLQFSQDVFDFGFLMLICAVGGLEFFESNDFIEKIKIFLDEISKKPQERSKYCCILHNEDLIAGIKVPENTINFSKIKPTKVNKSGITISSDQKRSTYHISIKQCLQAQRFSKEFETFLCKCLRFDPLKRSSIQSLLKSSFLRLNSFKGPNIDITELLKISEQWNRNSILPIEYQGASEKQLKKLCQAIPIVLPGIEKPQIYPELYKLRSDSQQIKDLANDLGMSIGKVYSSIKSMLKRLGTESEPIKTNR